MKTTKQLLQEIKATSALVANKKEVWAKTRKTDGQFVFDNIEYAELSDAQRALEKLKEQNKTKTQWLNEKIDEELSQ